MIFSNNTSPVQNKLRRLKFDLEACESATILIILHPSPSPPPSSVSLSAPWRPQPLRNFTCSLLSFPSQFFLLNAYVQSTVTAHTISSIARTHYSHEKVHYKAIRPPFFLKEFSFNQYNNYKPFNYTLRANYLIQDLTNQRG